MGRYMDLAVESMKKLDGKNGKTSVLTEQVMAISQMMHRYDEVLKHEAGGEHRRAMQLYIKGVLELSELENTVLGIVDVIYGEIESLMVLQEAIALLAPQVRNLEPMKGETVEDAVASSQYKALKLREYMQRVFDDLNELLHRDPSDLWVEHRAAHERAVAALVIQKEAESAAGPQPGPEAAPDFQPDGSNEFEASCDCVPCELTRRWADGEMEGSIYILRILSHYIVKRDFAAVQEAAHKALVFAVAGTAHTKTSRTLLVGDVVYALNSLGIKVNWDGGNQDHPEHFALDIPEHLAAHI